MSSLRSWLSQLASLRQFTSRKSSGAKARPRFRPTLELLEDRLAPATIIVNSTSDAFNPTDGQLTLREAITAINSVGINASDVTFTGPGYGTADTIKFSIGGGGAQTINVGGTTGATFGFALPGIERPVVIDGTTQPLFSNTTHVPLIELNGANVTTGFGVGLWLTAANGHSSATSVIKGLVINRFSFIGIKVMTDYNTVQTCYVGTDATGNVPRPNNLAGIDVTGGAIGNKIGGAGLGEGNLFSGNLHFGLAIDSGSTGTIVMGNYIGLNAAGTLPVPNGDDGIYVWGAPSNQIGGAATPPGSGINGIGGAANARNVISGNGRNGITLNLAGSTLNLVIGNYIGVNAAGTLAMPNRYGVWILEAKNNTIGGAPAAPATYTFANVISGNSLDGIVIEGAGSTGNKAQGNFIGADWTGTAAIPNVRDGVLIMGRASGNDIGGAVAGTNPGNVISGNTNGVGVRIVDPLSNSNYVRGNLIGLDASGNTALPNFVGVWVANGAGANNIGAAVAFPNTISGNSLFGVLVSGTGTSTNQVSANRIGTDPTGSNGKANIHGGVVIGQGASANTIFQNVISGNGADGVLIIGASGFSTTGNFVKKNIIGLQANGIGALGNARDGVRISYGAFANTIGGSPPDANGNTISSNKNNGVTITDAGSDGNMVQGNTIGIATDLDTPRGNNIGVLIAASAKNNIIGTVNAALIGQGNFIGSNNNCGVKIADIGTNGNKVRGNNIGLRPNGAQKRSNTTGVEIANGPTANIIGGASPAFRNVISGNSRNGVYIHGANGNSVLGNYIGPGLGGFQSNLGNGTGVNIFTVPGISAAIDTTIIGGMSLQEPNIISGNLDAGVQIRQSGAATGPPTVLIMGNRIGVDVNGAALPNFDGLVMQNDTHNILVGGNAFGAGNLISGNTRYGILMNAQSPGAPTSGNFIQGNFIGTQVGGVLPLGNGSHGVFLTGAGVSGNTIGGMLDVQTLAGNVIAFNLGRGVLIGLDIAFPASPTLAGIGNAVLGNRIFGNAVVGIDLGPNDGVTPNDIPTIPTADLDTGPNNLQNFPVLSSAIVGFGTIVVTGLLTTDGSAATLYRVEFFVGTSAGDAELYLGAENSVVNGVAFSHTWGLFPSTFLGRQIIATATNLTTMDTSEFSVAFTATP